VRGFLIQETSHLFHRRIAERYDLH
jgi:hypothetical protein